MLPVTAQEYSYARYDVKDGLAGSVVYHGVEDHDGFLWFGTETGVSRFDGTHFRNFTIADGLPDNEIIKLFVDSKNRVWMMPFRNSISYYWKGKIYNQENDSLLKRIPVAEKIIDIVEDSKGNLLFMDGKSIYFVDTDQHIDSLTTIEGARFNTSNAGLAASGNFNVLVLIHGEHALSLEIDAKQTIRNKTPWAGKLLMQQSSFLTSGLSIVRHGDGLTFKQGLKQHVLNPLSGLNSLSLINDTLCSFNTNDGSHFYDINNRKYIRHVLKGKNVNTVLRDKEGNFWFLTAGAGIFRIGSFEFINFTFTDNNKDYLSVFSLKTIDSRLYVGSEKSCLFIIDPIKQKVRQQQIIKGVVNTKINAIVSFDSNRIFLGTNQGVINLRRPELHANPNISVKSMHIDKDQLLISLHTGVLRMSEDLTFKSIVNYTRSTCSNVMDNLYYHGTLQGLFQCDSTGSTTWLGEKYPLFRSRITAIEVSPDGILWVGTHGSGIIGYKDGKIINSIRQKDGLTSDICRNIFIAGKDVWVGTDKGLNRLQWLQGRYQITTFSSDDGLIADIINAIQVDGSQVYVGTPAGLTTFDVDKISLNSYCKLRLTDIHVADKQWPHDTTGFTLPPTNNAIRFDYVGISYRSAGDITYQYRLVGLNENWQTTRETFLNYLSLPSGYYELQVRATNKFGVPSEMIRIPFLVEKLLWERAWFRVLVLLGTVALIWLFVYSRIKKANKQNDEKIQINNRMAELEQRALKAQMNPHFIFNSLNSVQQYVIDKDLLGANKFITEFSRLIRLTLDISSKSKISIYEEISYLTTYLELEKTKFEDKFSYSITLSPDMDAGEWFIPPMILQPYVENSIRHGVRYRRDKQGHIRISFLLDAQYLVCQVEDNGVGRKKAGEYKSEMPIEYQSKGMTLTARRIEMFNQNNDTPVLIHIEDLEHHRQPAGTRVTLQFPLVDAGKIG
jgi:ligand-binding sensor domain-containing protein/signal transduction histidine kinase